MSNNHVEKVRNNVIKAQKARKGSKKVADIEEK